MGSGERQNTSTTRVTAMIRTFKGYSDSGHGWAKVPRELLTELNIIGEISSCSYQLGQYVYLEEDCDLSTFFEAYLARTGKKPLFNMSYTNNESKIRGYECFDANSVTPTPSQIVVGMKVSIYAKEYEILGYNLHTKKYTVKRENSVTQYGVKLNQMRLIKETI